MTSAEIKNAMQNSTPIKFNGIEYQSITAYIYRRVTDIHTGMNKFIFQCELIDRCGHSVTIADAEKVEFYKSK